MTAVYKLDVFSDVPQSCGNQACGFLIKGYCCIGSHDGNRAVWKLAKRCFCCLYPYEAMY